MGRRRREEGEEPLAGCEMRVAIGALFANKNSCFFTASQLQKSNVMVQVAVQETPVQAEQVGSSRCTLMAKNALPRRVR